VYEEILYPWLVSEKQLISRAIAARKPILGVCLGAQLLSTVLGGTVAKMVDKEIGWFPVELVPGGRDAGLFRGFPAEFMAFHWHGDAFSIPPRAVHIAKSDACDEQAFVYDKHVVGLQFHLESTEQTIDALIEHCAEDFECGRYIQDQYGIADDSANHIPTAYSLLVRLLDNLVASSGETRSSVDVKE
jgi:GMP synthase-like glutamine amidotransferase